MIFTTLNQLPSVFSFIITDNNEFEKDFKYLSIIKNINFDIRNKINNEEQFITINPEFYFSNYKNNKLDLLIISVDPDNSYYINLIRYIKSNNLKDLSYKKKNFIKFLYKNFPLRKSRWWVINILYYFKISIRKKIMIHNIWYPDFYIKENLFKGKIVGKGDNNCYILRSPQFDEDFKFVYQNLSNTESQKIYSDIIFKKPSITWNNYFNNLMSHEHYQHYLDFKDSNIINLGVELGFEIPFFLSKNISSIINVDPSGEKNLHQYVKQFLRYYRDIISFENSYLYDSSKVEGIHKKKNQTITLIELIKKNNLQKNIIIKSDIEGLEINMLNEMPEIIEKYRPQLAISIYHIDFNLNPAHSQLTLIPKNLIKLCKNYNFYIQHYTYNRGETVFYCIPKEIQ